MLSSSDAILEYLSDRTNYEKQTPPAADRMGLDSIRSLARDLGDPQGGYSSCHIAGSKGKGSTAEMVAAILAFAGYRVGLYTSPHLNHIRQRIRIQGRPIPEEDFVRIFEDVRKALESRQRGECTFFDIMTATAFAAFRDLQVDLAVVETGLGGRLDSTNILDPAVCGITLIEMDHAEILGDTIESIAEEKAGIIKRGVPLVLGPMDGPARRVILEKAREVGVRVLQVGHHLQIREVQPVSGGSQFDLLTPDGVLAGLKIPLLGAGQVENAAVAVGIVDAWCAASGLQVLEKATRAGLGAARLPGRIQVAQEDPIVVIDGAHTRSSAGMLARVIRDRLPHRRLFLVLGVLADKQVEGILEELVPLSQEVLVTSVPSPRGLPPDDLGRLIRERFPWAILYSPGDPPTAIREALLLASKDDLVCIAGSMYLAGEAIRALGTG